MKRITFSRTFPAYHPKAGQPTHFVEKLLNSISKRDYFFCECKHCGYMGSSATWDGGGQIADTGDYFDICCPKCESSDYNEIEVTEGDYYIGKYAPKHHTIRATPKNGKKWKVGDKFIPDVWSGKPYGKGTKKIIIAPPIEVKKVWDLKIEVPIWNNDGNHVFQTFINDDHISTLIWSLPETTHGYHTIRDIANNDGLSLIDLGYWLNIPKKKPVFSGQIICWSDQINY